MKRKYVILSVLYLMTMGVFVMGFDSSWGLLLSVLSLLCSILVNRKDILIQDSHEMRQENSKSYFIGSYYYFGKNLDSYVLLFKMFIKFGVLTVGYTGVVSLFLYLGDSQFTVSFSFIYFICVIGLWWWTITQIHRVNPKFRQTLLEAEVALVLISCSFILWFIIMTSFPDFGFIAAKIVFLFFMCFSCYIVPVEYYYHEINEMTTYKIRMYGNIDEILSFQFKTVDGKIWELKKDFDFLVIQDSGDYYLILPENNYKLIRKEEIENFGYCAKK